MTTSVAPSRAEALGFSHDEDENEAYAIDLLDNWLYGADEVLTWANRIRQRAAVDEARASAALLSRMASDQVELIPELLDAAYSGKTWRAILCALYVGLAAGLIQSDPEIYHARRELREAKPHIERGRKVVAAAAKGGRSRRKGPPDEILVYEVEAIHLKYPRLSWSTVCERVARRHGLSRRTVETRARAADWRRHSD